LQQTSDFFQYWRYVHAAALAMVGTFETPAALSTNLDSGPVVSASDGFIYRHLSWPTFPKAITANQSALICVSFKAPRTQYLPTLGNISFRVQNQYGEHEMRLENHIEKYTERS
jgi:hypothetical protein